MIQNVRMGYVLAILRMVRLLGIAAIRARLADSLPSQDDPKGAERDSFQLNAGRQDADGVFL